MALVAHAPLDDELAFGGAGAQQGDLVALLDLEHRVGAVEAGGLRFVVGDIVVAVALIIGAGRKELDFVLVALLLINAFDFD